MSEEGIEYIPELPQKRSRASNQASPKNAHNGNFSHIYLNSLPSAGLYEKSYMHRTKVTRIVSSTVTDFIATGSEDGYVKLWKKRFQGIEFVKQFRAHVGNVSCLSMSHEGSRLASASSSDQTVKVFDVLSFDMIDMHRLSYNPLTIEFVHKENAPYPTLAVGHAGGIDVIKAEGEDPPLFRISSHLSPVRLVRFCLPLGLAISIDESGIIEYWDTETGQLPENIKFSYKSQTDLFELARNHTTAVSLCISQNGQHFAMWCKDKYVRVFHLLTGKLAKKYDERADKHNEIQNDPNNSLRLERMEFTKRMAIEREIDKNSENLNPDSSITFDESGNILIYSSYIGIKFISLNSNRLLRLIGKSEMERFLQISLFQGKPQRDTEGKSGGGGVTSQGEKESDPTIFCTALNRNRFYLFTKREPADIEPGTVNIERDIFNEKPTEEEKKVAILPKKKVELAKKAIIHTTLGDIYVKLFDEDCPKTVENFTIHCKNNYYNQVIFHRVIKGFMIQTGDPEGDGTGGTSIWGNEFEDEIHPHLKHDRPFTLSMANRGPNTNGSQFFITTVPCSWLDGRHTVFGRVYRGMDIVQSIECVPCDKKQKPLAEVRITKISLNPEE